MVSSSASSSTSSSNPSTSPSVQESLLAVISDLNEAESEKQINARRGSNSAPRTGTSYHFPGFTAPHFSSTSVLPGLTTEMPDYTNEKIDFAALALQFPDFARLYNACGGKLNFKDPETNQQLTKALLKVDFGLNVVLPDDRLCPPVPIRFSYILWIQSLLDTTSPKHDDEYDPERKVVGIDIGVGACCIYSLLATASRPGWNMYGTEIDDKNFESAQENVDLNDLATRIKLYFSSREGPLFPLDNLGVKHLDFTMCNPPFYSSKTEMQKCADNKDMAPSAVCTGAEVEMITNGGEVAFVNRMIDESLLLKDRVQWYTTMLGKMSSVHEIIARLKQLKIDNRAVCTLQGGSKTVRWAVAWSFGDLRPRVDIAKRGDFATNLHPYVTAHTIRATDWSRDDIATELNSWIPILGIKWVWDAENYTGIAIAKSNSWSRSARRKRARQNAGLTDEATKTTGANDDPEAEKAAGAKEEENAVLGVRLEVIDGSIEAQLLRAMNTLHFESFCAALARRFRDDHVDPVRKQQRENGSSTLAGDKRKRG